MASADQLKTRFRTAKEKRRLVESEIEDAYRYTQGTSFITPSNEPDRSHLYDTTICSAVADLVTTIMTYLVPQDKRWVGFSLSQRYKDRYGEPFTMRTRLAQAEAVYFEHVNGSDFYLSTSEALTDAVISGSGALGITVDDDGLCYSALPIHQIYYLSSGSEIDVVFREHSLPVRTVIEKYKHIPDWMKELEKSNPDKTVEVVESMVPSSQKRGHFDYTVHAIKGGWEELHSQTVAYKPFIVFRFDQPSGQSCWASSPVRMALPDVKSANQVMRDLMDDAEYIARPTYFTKDSSLSNIEYRAGTFIYAEGDDVPRALPRSGDLTVHVRQIDNLRSSINRIMMADVLPQGDRMTTAEVQIRAEKFFRRIGVHAIRLEEEYLQPVVRATVTALQKAMLLGSFTIDGDPTASPAQKEQSIVMSTRSLRQRVEAQAEADRVLGSIFAVSKLGPDALMRIDMTKAGDYMCEVLAIPPAMLRSDDEVQAMIKARQVVQAATGVEQTMSGQGSPETSKATGEAIAGLLPDIQQAMK